MLFTSIVLPFIAVTMSPGLTAWPLGMFSVDGTTAVSVTGRPSRAMPGHRLDHGGAARHVELHLLHLRRGLDRDPARVEGHGLAHVAQVRAARVLGPVAQHDQPRLHVRALGHRRRTRPCRAPRSPRGRAARPRASRARRRSRRRARPGSSGWPRWPAGSGGRGRRWPTRRATRARSSSASSGASPVSSSDSRPPGRRRRART